MSELKMVSLLKETYKNAIKPDNFDERRGEAIAELRNDISSRTKNILNTPRFSRFSDRKKNYQLIKLVKNRDGQRCVSCGENGLKTKYEVSHILPVELYPEYAFEEWNAVMECFECNHSTSMSWRGAAKSLREIL